LAFIAFLAACTCSTWNARADESEKAQRIGVVVISEVLMQYERSISSQKKINDMQRQALAVKQKMREQLTNTVKELENDLLAKETRRAKRKELREMEIKYEVTNKMLMRELEDLTAMLTNEIYQDLRRTIAEYSQEHGFDLILKDDEQRKEDKSIEEISTEIRIRGILYYAPSVDITEVIITRLNDHYRKGNVETESEPLGDAE